MTGPSRITMQLPLRDFDVFLQKDRAELTDWGASRVHFYGSARRCTANIHALEEGCIWDGVGEEVILLNVAMARKVRPTRLDGMGRGPRRLRCSLEDGVLPLSINEQY